MPTTEQLRNRLLKKLKELFQLDQPDLDFGFYRIMHAKAAHISDFIENDLFKIIEDAFGSVDDSHKAELQTAYDNALREAQDEYGSTDPESTPKAKKIRAKLDAVKDTVTAEGDIYDHLYRFFERYYDAGDFMSRRYYTRETSDKAAPYAIPYNGEEVKLHWANADQYYIKTSEYFANFTFDVLKAREAIDFEEGLFKTAKKEETRKVHFRIVDAAEGEHGNIKASDAAKRFFILRHDMPVEATEDGELIINFEFRPLPDGYDVDGDTEKRLKKEYGAKNKGDIPPILMADIVLEELKHLDISKEYLQLLSIKAPTEKIPGRPLLAKYIKQYTARNTMDYFIHKDLGNFLKRELDFYIKNEVMRLDDIENADAPAVETWLSKIKVLRRIAGKLIDFLAQLEDFQKKLWLKKKFVIETNYCITLDRIPEAFYPKIAANKAQHDEWVKLYAIDEIELDISTPKYSNPLTEKFLKANNKLVLDTQFFDDDFKSRLIASIENFDEQCDGLLIHSENFQALNMLQERYRGQVKCVYIDPPYNTDAAPIIYKNGYKVSSWNSLISDRLYCSSSTFKNDGILCATIDDFQQKELHGIIEETYGLDSILGTVIIRNNPSGRPIPTGFAIAHEYAIFASPKKNMRIDKLPRNEQQNKRYKETDEHGRFMWELLRKRGSNSRREDARKSYFPFYVSESGIRLPNLQWDESKELWQVNEDPQFNEEVVYPIDENEVERNWRWGIDTARKNVSELKSENKNGGVIIYYKFRQPEGITPTTNWIDSRYSATEHGTGLVKHFFKEYQPFSYPKSIYAVEDCISVAGMKANRKGLCFDYFAGSGTTGHAVINLNREDGGKRKYILVEMGDYFYSVLKPRISKVVYSENWKDGKPTTHDTGISHCFKYLRLESYEDTLNNLHFDENPARNKMVAANQSLKEDFMLRYLLDVETRGSQSLLNIDAFSDPCAYTLNIKQPGSDEITTRSIDLIETFNYLIGLRVNHIAAPQSFNAEFKRIPDSELPEDQHTKLVVEGKIKQNENGSWWFRKIEGWVPKDSASPNNGQQLKILIVWRKLTGDLEKDNAVLDSWFQKNRISTRDFEFDTIYVNGSNNLPNLQLEGDSWKVRLIEEEFMKRMWDVGGV